MFGGIRHETQQAGNRILDSAESLFYRQVNSRVSLAGIANTTGVNEKRTANGLADQVDALLHNRLIGPTVFSPPER